MRHRSTLLLLLAVGMALPGVAVAAPGDLDPGFDGDGRFALGFQGWEHAGASAVHAGPDGETLLSGSTNVFHTNGFLLSYGLPRTARSSARPYGSIPRNRPSARYATATGSSSARSR